MPDTYAVHMRWWDFNETAKSDVVDTFSDYWKALAFAESMKNQFPESQFWVETVLDKSA